MVKTGFFSLLLATLLMVFTACSSGPEPDTLDLDEDFKCMQQGASAPEWVCGNVEHDDLQVAVGMAANSKIGSNFTLREATANGVEKIKLVAERSIERDIHTFARSLEPELGNIADSSAQKIAKKVSQAKDNDYKQIKLWENPVNKDLFVLIAIQDKWHDQQVKDALISLYKADAAVWKKFQDDDGLDKLDDVFETD